MKSPLPQPIDRELADLAAAAYDLDAFKVGRWTRTTDSCIAGIPAGEGPTSKPDKFSGFKAAVFRRDDGKHAVAFCGSERETRDWLTNLAQGLGMDTAQYRQAAAFASECKAQFGDDIVLTGHSLGGGLAAVAAATTNTECVTFNPAGVHRRTLERAGVDPEGFQRAAEAGLVRKYVVKGEILSLLNKLPLAPKPPGAEIKLQDASGAWLVGRHSMTSMTAAMDAAGQRVTVAEGALPHPDPRAAAAALAFRKSPANEALQDHPALKAAYALLERVEAKASSMPPESGKRLVDAMRNNLATRIERGEKIPMPTDRDGPSAAPTR